MSYNDSESIYGEYDEDTQNDLFRYDTSLVVSDNSM